MSDSVFKRRWILWLVVMLAIVGAVALLRSPKPDSSSRDEGPTLSVTAATRGDIQTNLQLPGEFIAYQEVDVDAKVRGYIEKMNVDIGDVVKQGQVLATLDIPEARDQLRQAAAAIDRANQDAARLRAQYEDDKAIYERLAQVMKARPELIAQQDLDQSKARFAASQAAYSGAQAAAAEARADRERLQSINDYERITAPFDAIVTQRFVSSGALVGENASRAIFHVSQVQKLRLVLKPPESAVPHLAIGMPAKIDVASLQQHLELPLSRISHELSTDTRTMHAEVDVDNAALALAPGMFAQVTLTLEHRDDVITVPLSALHERKDAQATIYVLKPDQTVEARKAKLGLADENRVEVVSGVALGDKVVLDSVPVADGRQRYSPQSADDQPAAGADH